MNRVKMNRSGQNEPIFIIGMGIATYASAMHSNKQDGKVWEHAAMHNENPVVGNDSRFKKFTNLTT